MERYRKDIRKIIRDKGCGLLSLGVFMKEIRKTEDYDADKIYDIFLEEMAIYGKEKMETKSKNARKRE